MQQEKTIRIDVNLDDSEIKNLNSIIQDLVDVSNNLSTSFQYTQSNLEKLGNEVGGMELVFNTQRTAMNYLRDAAFFMNRDYGDLIEKLNSLESIQRISAAATEAKTTALNLKSAAAIGATWATKGLSTALKALPFVGIGIAVLSLAGNFLRWIDNLNTTNDSISETEQRLKDLEDRLFGNRDAHDSNIRAVQAQNRFIQNLINTVEELTDSTDLSADGQRRLRVAAELINASTSDYTITLDEATNRLDENSRQVLDNIRDYHNLSAATSESGEHLERMLELHRDKNNAIMRTEELSDAHREAEETLARYRQEVLEIANEIDYLSIYQGEHNRELSEASERVREASVAFDEVNGTMMEYAMIIDNATEELEILGAQVYETMTNATIITEENVGRQVLSYEILSDAQREVVYAMLERWTMYRDNGREMFSELGESTKLFATVTDEHGNEIQKSYRELEKTSDEVMQSMIDNMVANREATASWSGNLDDLAAQTSEEFAQHMREMGVESAWYVQQMLDGCEDLLQQLHEEFQASGDQAGENLVGSLGECAKDVIPVVEQIADTTSKTLNDRFDAADFASIGASVVEVTVEGLLREGPTAERAAIKAGNYVLVGFEDTFKEGEEQMFQSGRNMLLGFNDGVEEMIPESCTVSRDAALAIYEELRGFNEENSPSRLYMRSGRNMVAGLIQGIESIQNRPVNRMEQLARNMQRVYNSANRDYTTIGRDITNGLNQGLLNGEAAVMATTRRIANNVVQTMRKALDINSPSRVMREQIGKKIPMGIASGIDKYTDYAIDSVYDLGKELIKVNIPKVNEIISIGPANMRLPGTNTVGNVTHVTNDQSVDYAGLFEGCHIHWHNETDVRELMIKMAREIDSDRARMW